MSGCVLMGVFASWFPPLVYLGEHHSERPAMDCQVVYKQFTQKLLGKPLRVKSARPSLEYWHAHSSFLMPPVRSSVKTKDGKIAQMTFLKAPSTSIPGTDFSMVFLEVDTQVVDWTSCWTCNTLALQDIRLEDVDRDGFLDLAFRAREGFWGLTDKRCRTRPGDKRRWLYAYSITSKGFKSIFPLRDRQVELELLYDSPDRRIKLAVGAFPKSVREFELLELRISMTNMSKQELIVPSGMWLNLDVRNAAYFMTSNAPSNRRILRSGETVSGAFQLVFNSIEEQVSMLHCRFMPQLDPSSEK